MAAGLAPRAVRLKDFRTTVVTVLFEEQYEEAVIQKIVGHAVGTKVTRRNYHTAREAVHRRAMAAIRTRLLPTIEPAGDGGPARAAADAPNDALASRDIAPIGADVTAHRAV
jgi:hypothetical protein